jgi:phthiodiolone/phenolphthiodiolone dimycocerosates ketoreductase
LISASDRLTVGTLGTLMPPAANLGKNARRNEEQGYAALWWPDHYMGWFPQSLWTPDITPLAAFQPNPDIFFDPLIAIAAAAGSTRQVKLGTAVTEALRRHPVELAQAFLTLDHLAPGRIICGLGSGEALNLLPYGIPFDHPVGRLEEAVRVIRLLWSSDGPVDFEGEYFRLQQAVLGLKPTPEGPPEMWLAAHGPRMLEITGRYADGWLPEFLPLDDYRGRLQRIEQARAVAGRSAEPFTPGMYAKLVLTDEHEAAHALMKTPLLRILALTQPAEAFARHGVTHPLGEQAFGVRDFIPVRYSRDQILGLIDGVPPAVVEAGVLHGTPEDVAQQLAAYARVGLRHIVLWNVTFFGDASLIRRSYELMGSLLGLLREIRVGEWAASRNA